MGCSSCAARRKAAEEARKNKLNSTSSIPTPIPTPLNGGNQPSPKFRSPLVLPPAKK